MSGGPGRDVRAALAGDPMAVACAATLALLVAAAIAGPWLLDYREDEIDWAHMATPPFEAPGHWLGTDRLGRDLLVRTLLGLRVSLAIAFAATLVALVIGVAWGAFAGFRRGRTDALMMRFVDVLYALPQVFFVIILTVVFGRGPLTLPQVILVESFLSFLGIGIQEPLASLGNLIADGAAELETAPWMLAVPAACLMLVVFCCNFLGDSLRDALDPRDR